MKRQYTLLALVVSISATTLFAWHSGWNAHADHINALVRNNKKTRKPTSV